MRNAERKVDIPKEQRKSQEPKAKWAPALFLCLLCTTAFTLGAILQQRVYSWTGRGGGRLMQVLLGDGRRVLANQFFTTADIYFHSGAYPSIFDRRYTPTNSAVARGVRESPEQEDAEHDREMALLNRPLDWIERFGRNFQITKETHLAGGKAREILPWLKLSADLDPKNVDTYTVASYWLRVRLGKPKEAEEFLREGLLANPDSYEILLELGRLYSDNYHDLTRARNLWEAAYRRWNKREASKPSPDLRALDQITVGLAWLEEKEGHYGEAIKWLKIALAKKASPNPEGLEARLKELQAKLKEAEARSPAPKA
jgi:tetratricopeptide (TPR) repeat protein